MSSTKSGPQPELDNVQAGFRLLLVLFQSIRHRRSWWRRFKLSRIRFRRGWAFHPFHLAIKIAKNCIDCFRFFCICKTFVGVVRCVMLAFGLFPIKEVALQVRESDSRILIRLYSYKTESLSRYVHLLEPSSFLPILRCFHISRQCKVQVCAFTLAFFFSTNVQVFNLEWAMSGTCHILASRMSATALHRFTSRKNFVLLHEGLQVNNVPRFCRQWPTQKVPRQGQKQVRRQGQNRVHRQGQNQVHRQGQNRVHLPMPVSPSGVSGISAFPFRTCRRLDLNFPSRAGNL